MCVIIIRVKHIICEGRGRNPLLKIGWPDPKACSFNITTLRGGRKLQCKAKNENSEQKMNFFQLSEWEINDIHIPPLVEYYIPKENEQVSLTPVLLN